MSWTRTVPSPAPQAARLPSGAKQTPWLPSENGSQVQLLRAALAFRSLSFRSLFQIPIHLLPLLVNDLRVHDLFLGLVSGTVDAAVSLLRRLL